MIYTYDSSYYGMLSCIYAHYYKEAATEIFDQHLFQGTLIDDVVFIKTNLEHAQKVEQAIREKFTLEGYLAMYRSFLSNERNKDCYILKYLIEGFKLGPKIDRLYSENFVIKIREMSKRVGFEAHRFLGLLRFVEKNQFLYASFEPDNDVLPLIADHFADRFINERIIIHDIKRGYGVLSYKGKWFIQDISKEEAELLLNTRQTAEEDLLQDLWKSYFEHIAIEGRKNLKLQQGFVPLKYRKHIVEFN